MPNHTVLILTIGLAAVVAGIVGFLLYIAIYYGPIIGRIFEEKPLFLPLRLAEEPGGSDVRFKTEDGFTLAGTYYQATTRSRVGLLVFCHEYLGNRWSFAPYAGALRALGFDIFTFDFRNHGESDSDSTYRPLQWVTDHEVRDLQAALRYLRSRPDYDAAGVALYGVSRGGSTSLIVAAQEPSVWGIITDGAFPTRGTMLAYIVRWAEIYVSNPYLWRSMPNALFRFAAWTGRVRSERRLNCRFPDVERAVGRLAPRAWLMIHGEKDAYIGTNIARTLFALASEPKELWIVPKAKHNRCREVAPAEYAEKIKGFFRSYAPRRPIEIISEEPAREAMPEPDAAVASAAAGPLEPAAPVVQSVLA